MAAVAGYTGNVTFTNLQANVKGWVLNIVGDALETTDYADGGVATYIRGVIGWSATVTLSWDSTHTATAGSSATLSLQATTGSTYSGAAILTGNDITSSVRGLVESTATFQGTGALTYPS